MLMNLANNVSLVKAKKAVIDAVFALRKIAI